MDLAVSEPGWTLHQGVATSSPATLPSTEAELARLAAQGDREAWDALIGRHDRVVFLAVLAVGLPPTRAREVVQETWLRLFEKARNGELQRVELPGLALRHARWRARDVLRHEQHVESTVEDPSAFSSPRDLSRALLARDQLERLGRRLARLPERRREIFLRFYRDQHSAAEIAQALGMSVQRVRQSLHETRRTLLARWESA